MVWDEIEFGDIVMFICTDWLVTLSMRLASHPVNVTDRMYMACYLIFSAPGETLHGAGQKGSHFPDQPLSTLNYLVCF